MDGTHRHAHASKVFGAMKTRPAKPTTRTRVTNGHELLPDVDGRSLWVRRFRDVNALHLSDRGGEDNCSEAEKAIAKRVACLIVELEQMERRFATNGGGQPCELDQYQRLCNTLRRLLETLASGLARTAKDVTGPTLGQLLRADLDREAQQR
jgi:hypothetical protein